MTKLTAPQIVEGLLNKVYEHFPRGADLRRMDDDELDRRATAIERSGANASTCRLVLSARALLAALADSSSSDTEAK